MVKSALSVMTVDLFYETFCPIVASLTILEVLGVMSSSQPQFLSEYTVMT